MCTVLPVVGVGKGGRVLIDLRGYLKAVLYFGEIKNELFFKNEAQHFAF